MFWNKKKKEVPNQVTVTNTKPLEESITIPVVIPCCPICEGKHTSNYSKSGWNRIIDLAAGQTITMIFNCPVKNVLYEGKINV